MGLEFGFPYVDGLSMIFDGLSMTLNSSVPCDWMHFPTTSLDGKLLAPRLFGYGRREFITWMHLSNAVKT